MPQARISHDILKFNHIQCWFVQIIVMKKKRFEERSVRQIKLSDFAIKSLHSNTCHIHLKVEIQVC